MAGSGIPRFDALTIDCPDPVELARFYSQLLEWPMPDVNDMYPTIDPPGGGTAITFQPAENYVAPTWPDSTVAQQMHIDFRVVDIEAAHERAIALGARHLDTQDTFRVYADPVGHLFCFCHS